MHGVGFVTGIGVWLLAAQKPVKRQGCWKVCFISEAGHPGRGQAIAQRLTPRPPTPRTDGQGAGGFIDRGRGLHAETAPPALRVVLKPVISGLVSVISVVLSTVNPQGQAVCFHLSEASSQNCDSSYPSYYGLVTTWFPSPPGGGFGISKTAHRIWLRISSKALKRN